VSHDGQWLRFNPRRVPGRKTPIYDVLTKQEGNKIGEIRYWGAWRAFVFVPGFHTIYETTCLRDLATFCERQTAEHRSAVRRRRHQAATA